MSSNSIYKQPKYCVYLTIYLGNKMPPFYIGSTSVSKIQHGYRGSVKSKRYKEIWELELKQNPHLFKTKIVGIFHSRKYASYKEKKLQQRLNVIYNPMYINMAITGNTGYEVLSFLAKEQHRLGVGFGSNDSKEKAANANRQRVKDGTHNFIIDHPMQKEKNKIKHSIRMKEIADVGLLNFQTNNPLKDPEFAKQHNIKIGKIKREENVKRREILKFNPEIPGVIKRMRTILINLKNMMNEYNLPSQTDYDWDNAIVEFGKRGYNKKLLFKSNSVLKYFGGYDF